MNELSFHLKRRFIDEMARRDFLTFSRLAFEITNPGEFLTANYAVKAVTHALLDVSRDETFRLIINAPPRSMKSLLASVYFPAFLHGHDPQLKIICASHAMDLAHKHANDYRALVGSDFYRRLFPRTRLSPNKNTETEVMFAGRGYRLAASVGGPLVGRGADIIILDDIIKPDDAMSSAARIAARHWFESTLLSRLDDKKTGKIILVMQRLHEDDLAGQLLQTGVWRHLKLSAIASEDEKIPVGGGEYGYRKAGEALDPDREPLNVLENIKRSMGSAAFSAQYLQEPIPPEGALIKGRWILSFDVAPPWSYSDRLVISLDAATSRSELANYSAATVWHAKGERYYLIDAFRERLEFPQLKHKIDELMRRHPRATLLVEKASAGTSLEQVFRGAGRQVIGVTPDGDKVMRLARVSPIFEGGGVYFPNNAPWLDVLKAELLAFPSGRHDDQVDSISQALWWLNSPDRTRPNIFV